MLDLSYIFKDMTERTEKRVNRFNGESVMLTPEEARDIGQSLVQAAEEGEEIALRIRMNKS